MSTSSSLTAPLRVSFDYTRSVGPVLGVFFSGLREGRLIGAHTSRVVVVPPPEYDGAQPPSEFFEVADVSGGISLCRTLGFLLLCLAVVWWIFRTGFRLKK